MTEDHTPKKPLPDLSWWLEQMRHGFAHLAEVRGYTDEQFRTLEEAVNQFDPLTDELDDLLVNLGVLLEED